MGKTLANTLKHNLRKALNQDAPGDAEEILPQLKKAEPLSKETRGLKLSLYGRCRKITQGIQLLSRRNPDLQEYRPTDPCAAYS